MRKLTLVSVTSLMLFSLLAAVGPTPARVPPGIPAPTAAAPVAALNFYFGNLHAHTAYSDGTGTPKEAFDFARKVGKLDFLAITEHNHIKAEGTGDDPLNLHIAKKNSKLYEKLIADADAATEDGEFVALYGQEFSTIQSGGNHTNVFMASKVIRTKSGNYHVMFTDEWMEEHGAAVIQLNHPWEMGLKDNLIGSAQDQNYGFDKFDSVDEFIQAVEGRAALIEVFNGPGTLRPKPGQVFRPKGTPGYYLAYLNMGLHLAPTANQDNHFRTWGTQTDARTVILAPRLTRQEILAAMKERRVYASQDKDLKITFTVNGEAMGSRLAALTPGKSAKIEVGVDDDGDDDSSYKVTIFYDNAAGGNRARRVFQAEVKNRKTMSFQDKPTNGRGYYLVSVESVKGGNLGKTAWTAPVWFE